MAKAFAGTNFYLINTYVNKLKNDFILQNGDMSVEEIDCEEAEFDTVIHALQSSALFTENKLVIAKNIAKNKKLSEQIEKIFSLAENANDLVIVEKDIDKRGAYYKFLKKNAEFVACDELNEEDLTKWLLNEAKNSGTELSYRNAKYLINRVGFNQQILYGELLKLTAYDKTISKESIDSLTLERPSSSIFNLLDAAFAGNSEAALEMYEEQKAQGSAPQSIFGMIVWQANIIAAVAAGNNLPQNELAAATGIKPFSINKASNIYKKIGRRGMNDLLSRLVKTDRQMKTRSADADELLKNLLATIS